jgi:hypothetical protein
VGTHFNYDLFPRRSQGWGLLFTGKWLHIIAEALAKPCAVEMAKPMCGNDVKLKTDESYCQKITFKIVSRIVRKCDLGVFVPY